VQFSGVASLKLFYLIESKTYPNKREVFRKELKDDETFESEFIGASEEECQKWALEKQFQVKFLDQDIIAIADARSAKDDTLLIQYYARDMDPPEPYLEFPGFGVLPKKRNIWYDYRIDYKDAAQVHASLQHVSPDCSYPTYFGRKEQLTDEHGVFNVAKATLFCEGKDPDTP
jgi:hypothetical protein